MEFQYENIDDVIRKAIDPSLSDKVEECINEEELNDYYEYFQVKFG